MWKSKAVVVVPNRQAGRVRTRSPRTAVSTGDRRLPDRQDVLGQRAHLLKALQGLRMVGEESQPGSGAAQLADGAQHRGMRRNQQLVARFDLFQALAQAGEGRALVVWQVRRGAPLLYLFRCTPKLAAMRSIFGSSEPFGICGLTGLHAVLPVVGRPMKIHDRQDQDSVGFFAVEHAVGKALHE